LVEEVGAARFHRTGLVRREAVGEVGPPAQIPRVPVLLGLLGAPVRGSLTAYSSGAMMMCRGGAMR